MPFLPAMSISVHGTALDPAWLERLRAAEQQALAGEQYKAAHRGESGLPRLLPDQVLYSHSKWTLLSGYQ